MAKKEIAVIGLGTFGRNVVKALAKTDCEVIAIDENQEKVQDISEIAEHAVQADATDEKVLRELGVFEMDVIVVAIGQNLEASILVTMILKNMDAKFVIAKALSTIHAKLLRKIGADKIVFPERDLAERLVNSLISPNILDIIELSPDYSLMEVKIPKKFADKTLKECDIRSKYGINVVAIKRKEPYILDDGNTNFKEVLNISPEADYEMCEGDILMVIGEREKLAKLKGID
ncbi:potassium channel family protein [bacterium]